MAVVDFLDNIATWQSESTFRSMDHKTIIDSFNKLPEDIKKAITTNKIDALFRSVEGNSAKITNGEHHFTNRNVMSFSEDKGALSLYGDTLIKGTDVESYDVAISTKKIVKFLNSGRSSDKNEDHLYKYIKDNKLVSDISIGDDEGETILLNAKLKGIQKKEIGNRKI